MHQSAYWKQRENAVNVFSLSISRDTLSRSRTGGQSNLPKTSHQNHDQNYSYKVLDLSCDNCTTCWRLFFASRSIPLFMRFLCSPPRIPICATYFTTPVCHLTCPHPPDRYVYIMQEPTQRGNASVRISGCRFERIRQYCIFIRKSGRDIALRDITPAMHIVGLAVN